MDRGKATRGSSAHWSEGEEGEERVWAEKRRKIVLPTALRKLLYKPHGFLELTQEAHGLPG